MSTQPVEANVVLTADNSQYDASMAASTQSTNNLAKSLDTLGTKLNNLTKSAGRKLLGITAADVAVITGATAAWASYEKQMSRLQAQAAIVGRGRDAETKTMNAYTESVKNLRKEFGVTTTEAAQLTQQISKMADNTRGLKDLSTTFEQMSKATGESSSGLANSLLNLQKIMGTPQSQTRHYADQLTYLAAKSNTTATALGDFTAQIAPMGRAMGMSQTQVTGFSNMFIKAGQDGYSAATAFNKVAQDITQAVQTGSPEMRKYANVLGVTVDQFKNMSGAEQVAGFLDQIAKLGPRAAQELNRFGFDGIRMSKSITATVQASGGAMNAIREAQIGYGSNATAEGAKAAEGMTDTLSKLRQELQMTAEAFGQAFGPGIGIVLKGVEAVAGGFERLMEGPLGKFLQVASAVIIPVTAIGGAMALLAGTIIKLSGAFMLLRNSAALGLTEGMRGGARMVAEVNEAGLRTGAFTAFGGGRLGPRGAQIAEGGTWLQRGLYNTGQSVGGGIRGGFGFLGGVGREGGGGPNIWSRGGAAGIRFGSEAFRSQLDQMRYANPADRMQFFSRYFPGRGPQMAEAAGLTAGAQQRATQAQAVYAARVGAGVGGEEQAKKAMHQANQGAAAALRSEKAMIAQAAAATTSAGALSAASKTQLGVYATMRAEGNNVARAFAGAAAGAVKFSASMVAQGGMRAGGALMGALGGPIGLALTGAMLLPMLLPLIKRALPSEREPYKYQDVGAAGAPYLAAGGITPPPTTAGVVGGGRAAPRTVVEAKRIDAGTIAAASTPGRKLSDPNLKGLNPDQAMNYLANNFRDIRSNPAALDAVKVDLVQQFGAEQADSMITQLSGGMTGQPGLFEAAGTSRFRNLGAGMRAETAGRALQTGGLAGLVRARAEGITSLVGRAARAPGEADAVITELNKTYGLNLTTKALTGRPLQPPGTAIRDLEPGKFGPDLQAATEGSKMVPTSPLAGQSRAAQLQYMIENAPRAQADQLRAQLAIPAGATGAGLTRAITSALRGRGISSMTPDDVLSQRVQETGGIGRTFEASTAVQRALATPENVELRVGAINTFLDKMREAGKTAPQITAAMGDIQSAIGDPTDKRYILAGFVSGQAQQQLALQMPTMTRAQGFATQVQQFQAVAGIRPVTPEQFQARQEATVSMAGAISDQVNYFKQLLLQQDQFEKQQRRAQQDFSLQRQYSEHDYQLQRGRAEENFTRMRGRATADYYRNVRRAHYDFNLSRSRQEADFNHGIELQAKQMATSIYSVYQRVQTERTSSASWLLANAGDQLARMREQSKNLDTLRARGLGDAAIQQMGLTSPEHAQELARLTATMNQSQVQQFNKMAGDRVKATKKLVTDESSLEAQENLRGYRLMRARAGEDFDRQMRLSRMDFHRGMRQQKSDFDLMMGQQAVDYKTGMERQEQAYHLTMKRAAKDMSDMTKEISMSMEEVLQTSATQLSGSAGKQARAVLASFQKLRKDTRPEAIALMKDLAAIFGFEYTVPKAVQTSMAQSRLHAKNQTGEARSDTGGHGTGSNYASGGMVPGWSPGRDTTTVGVSGGEAVMRPEWARAVGRGAVDAMNHQAKYGGFADGGMVNPDQRVYMDGEPISRITKAQLLLAEKLSHINFSTMQGSWQPYTAYSGSSHMGPGVVDESPGNFSTQYWLRRVGFAAWGRNFPGAAHAGSGAHVHAVSRLDPGARYHAQLSSFARGEDGLGGPDYGPNPQMLPGLMGMLSQFTDLVLSSGSPAPGGGGGVAPGVSSVLKRLYPRSEAAAKAMTGVHPLWPGDISYVMNQMVRKRYAESLEGIDPNKHHTRWAGAGGVFSGAQQIGVGESGPEAVIPLDARGADFMTDVMAHTMGGRASAPMRGGMTLYQTRVDRSTNFTGPITVQANNPTELLAKLQARQRVMALSRPSLTGSAA